MSKKLIPIVPDKDSETQFEPFYTITVEDFKQAIIEAYRTVPRQISGEEYYKNKYT